MALRSPSSTPRRDLGPYDSPPEDSSAPTSQGGSSNGVKAVGKKTKDVDHLLAKLEEKGVKIDGKIASIIDDGIARIKAEAARENINEPTRDRMALLDIIACIGIGFHMGVEWYCRAFLTENDKKIRARDEELAKNIRA